MRMLDEFARICLDAEQRGKGLSFVKNDEDQYICGFNLVKSSNDDESFVGARTNSAASHPPTSDTAGVTELRKY
jgi:hypothetical protein